MTRYPSISRNFSLLPWISANLLWSNKFDFHWILRRYPSSGRNLIFYIDSPVISGESPLIVFTASRLGHIWKEQKMEAKGVQNHKNLWFVALAPHTIWTCFGALLGFWTTEYGRSVSNTVCCLPQGKKTIFVFSFLRENLESNFFTS